MLKLSTKQLLNSLSEAINDLKEEDYSREIAILNHTPISKHVRHILDFYLCLLDACKGSNATVCYDKRRRDDELEHSVNKVKTLIEAIQIEVENLDLDYKLQLLQKIGGEQIHLDSTVARELLYNLEHAIHHMAIIKIAFQSDFGYVTIDKNFGIAPSTVAHRNENA